MSTVWRSHTYANKNKVIERVVREFQFPKLLTVLLKKVFHKSADSVALYEQQDVKQLTVTQQATASHYQNPKKGDQKNPLW